MNRDLHTSRLLSFSHADYTSLPLQGNISHLVQFSHQAPVCATRSMQNSLVYFCPFYPSALAGLSQIFEMFASVGLMSETGLRAKVETGCKQEAKVDIGVSFSALLSPSDRPSFEL